MEKLFLFLLVLGMFLPPFNCKAARNLSPCGMSPSDWCPAPAGDPCGTHRNKAECKADLQCQGKHYRGESVVACMYGSDGYATNCPTVGCLSLCEKLSQEQCGQSQGACHWVGNSCAK